MPPLKALPAPPVPACLESDPLPLPFRLVGAGGGLAAVYNYDAVMRAETADRYTWQRAFNRRQREYLLAVKPLEDALQAAWPTPPDLTADAATYDAYEAFVDAHNAQELAQQATWRAWQRDHYAEIAAAVLLRVEITPTEDADPEPLTGADLVAALATWPLPVVQWLAETGRGLALEAFTGPNLPRP